MCGFFITPETLIIMKVTDNTRRTESPTLWHGC